LTLLRFSQWLFGQDFAFFHSETVQVQKRILISSAKVPSPSGGSDMTQSSFETKKQKPHLAVKSLVLGLLAIAAVPAMAQAQPSYDGYCYQQKDRAQTRGAAVGAITGAAIGNAAAGRGSRGEGTVLGGVVGALIGSSIGNDSVSCAGGRYYSYDQGYYAPPPPPRDQVVVYYRDRPRFYDERTVVIYNDGPRYYNDRRPVYREYRGYDRYHDHHHHRSDRW
jgi:hypothetical protein